MPATITAFFGHFHPLLVHLPIGFLLSGLLLQWLSRREKYRGLQQAVPVILLWGAISATLSAITGYLLSNSDDYDKNLVSWHQWMGISVALAAWLLYAKEKNRIPLINRDVMACVLLLLIVVTGHLGGSLTHGSDYLTKPLTDAFSSDSTAGGIKPLANVQDAVAYQDVIKPILQTKCYSCHGPNKQKGKLRMDDEQLLIKGGKDGKVIEAGDGSQSEMIKRLLLPVDNEDHMPPKEKPQPTEAQIALLHWWIDKGADFNKNVKDLDQSEKIKTLLLALQKAPEKKEDLSFIPSAAVEEADQKVIDQLKQKGIVVLPVAQNSNYLSVNFVTHTKIDDDDLRLLVSVKKQLVWLKLSGTDVSDAKLNMIGDLTNLERLNLDHTSISDAGLADLKRLAYLKYLNLVDTKVTSQGVLQLTDLKQLQALYLYQTKINNAEWAMLKSRFPKTQIDSGGYSVETLPTDTVVVKAKKN